jgi:Domain of unknown function (DUF4799)
MLKWTVKKRFSDQQQLETQSDMVDRLHSRRSFGDTLVENSTRRSTPNNAKYHRRRSLGSNLMSEKIKFDKENHLVTPVRNKYSRQSSTPLGDCSNLQRDNCKRKHNLITATAATSPPISPISLNVKDILIDPSAAIFPTSYAPTLPTFDVEYSPDMKSSHRFTSNKSMLDFEEVPTKRLKLDLHEMSYEFKPESASTSSPLSTPIATRKFGQENKPTLQLSNDFDSSLNSSEVGDSTLQQMIDDILASARNGKKFKSCVAKPKSQRDKNSNFMQALNEVCESMEQKSIEKLLSPSEIAQAADKTIILAADSDRNEREVKSPLLRQAEENINFHTEETCQLKRQNAVRRKNTSNEIKIKQKIDEHEKELNNCSIQKCLSFSSVNFDDVSDKFKRSSVASSSSSSTNSYVSLSSKNLLMRGSLEMSLTMEENRKKIVIHGESGKVLKILKQFF